VGLKNTPRANPIFAALIQITSRDLDLENCIGTGWVQQGAADRRALHTVYIRLQRTLYMYCRRKEQLSPLT
jgi:hypothetical protein